MFPSFFKKLRKSTPEADSSGIEASRAQIRNWQKMLAEEHGRLGHDLTELLSTYERSLNYFAAHVNELDAASLQKECQSLEAIRSVLGNTVRRLEVSTKDDHELQEEWQEWQALLESATQPLEATQEQRREMVRSELFIRGKLPATPSAPIAGVEFSRPSIAAPISQERTIFIEEKMDDLDDWQAIYGRELEAATQHWQEHLEDALTLAPRDPVYAAAIVGRVRAWQGERKQFSSSRRHRV